MEADDEEKNGHRVDPFIMPVRNCGSAYDAFDPK